MTAAPNLFTWLRGLLEPVLRVTSAERQSSTYSRDSVEALERLWPFALDVIEAYERMRVGRMDEYDVAKEQMQAAHKAFLFVAAEKERA